ncbi:TetR family transcriptional regulator [Planotetraspora thailandica]|uniref:TetR family transcriptional regulator n=1 Tax=Planotetraspora thailandica TaxID=487172 RepID=A0A8J3V0F7_9ACTN|nr:TetR/AcrR family transcriptional regulator [Planotetraspora thailandica]GII55183.1 TetR family transcriptional regulator [Planotetraspora thailandica]
MGTRDRIVAAAEQVIQELGLARATTREIARAAGCSEALLYKHFSRKEDLFLAVLLERVPALVPAVTRLNERVGKGAVRENLEEFAQAAVVFYRRSLPLSAGVVAEASLLDGFRRMLADVGGGPHIPINRLGAYLREEQRLGRVGPDADPDAAATLLMGACFHRALLESLVDLGPDDTLVPGLVGGLMAGLAPRSSA